MDKLKKLLEQRKAILEKIDNVKNQEELNTVELELRKVDLQIEVTKAEIEADEARSAAQTTPPIDTNIASMPPILGQQQQQQRGMAPNGQLNPMGTYTTNSPITQQQQRTQEPEDRYATLEYRKAFMKFCTTGEIAPELRADAVTTTGDVSAVIPSTILNEVIKKVTSYGQIFSRVRKLNVKGGLTIPILSLKPTATWIGETSVSERKKVQANTNISFSYYGLECRVSTSLLSDTVMLTGFENVITDLIVEAMTKALDLAVLSGDGTGKPLGITQDTRVPASQIVTLKSDEVNDWSAWKKKVFAKMPLSYKGGATFFMASGTFEGYIDGMVDANGQPIGRVNYGITNGPQESFGGKSVIQVEDDIIAPYDDAAVGDVIAIYCNLSNYGFNSNMQMMMYRYFDQEKNEWVDKAILIADGKLIDPNGVVIIKKGA